MKTIFKYLIIAITLFTLSTCKKYDEGGIMRQGVRHLFGGRKEGSSKTWKLKLFEVNGIDSTFLIPGANGIPDFYKETITFTLINSERGKGSPEYSAVSFLYEHYGSFGLAYPEMTIGKYPADYTKNDSLQCKTKDNILFCSRDLIFPELNKGFVWQISKLTKNEFIITTQLRNSYKIIFTQ